MVLGKTRAKQYYSEDHARTKHMPILMHGDGAFSGQVVGGGEDHARTKYTPFYYYYYGTDNNSNMVIW